MVDNRNLKVFVTGKQDNDSMPPADGMISHQRKGEKFYSHGSMRRSLQEGGFFSFGLWSDDTADYQQWISFEALAGRFIRALHAITPDGRK
jgi:hypothetical protein